VPPEIRRAPRSATRLNQSAEQAEVIIIMVRTPRCAERAVQPRRRCRRAVAGKTVIDMSSISPIETKLFAAEIVAKGCDYVDAPVSGGEVGARRRR